MMSVLVIGWDTFLIQNQSMFGGNSKGTTAQSYYRVYCILKRGAGEGWRRSVV
jgi:hypothetical protein